MRLESTKQALEEAVILPVKFPQFFTGGLVNNYNMVSFIPLDLRKEHLIVGIAKRGRCLMSSSFRYLSRTRECSDPSGDVQVLVTTLLGRCPHRVGPMISLFRDLSRTRVCSDSSGDVQILVTTLLGRCRYRAGPKSSFFRDLSRTHRCQKPLLKVITGISSPKVWTKHEFPLTEDSEKLDPYNGGTLGALDR
ncbi:hypothetical protein Fmac_028330 [Flemingia macrophylla]|uniref:Uncharacterized protein n=1 Tax=Flemingia macrophylla TaxID=520843 RepID=A0ABD1L774_9FABA